MKSIPIISVLVLTLLPHRVVSQVPTLIPLGDLPGGLFVSTPNALSGNGLIAVGHSQNFAGFSGPEAFRWTQDEGMIGLGRPTGGASSARGISPNGQYVVGNADSADGNFGVVWMSNGNTSIIPDIPGGRDVSVAADASNNGVVVGSSQYAGGQFGPLSEAFRWTETGGLQRLGFLNEGDEQSTAFAISADGSVIAGRGSSGNWLWTEDAGMQFTIGNEFLARSITDNGQFVIGRRDITINGQIHPHAAFWSEDTGTVMLDRSNMPAGTLLSGAVGATPNAEVILGTVDVEPYIWFDQGAIGMLLNDYLLDLGLDVEALGYNMFDVAGISNDGSRLLISTFNPNNDPEAVLIIIPSPATIALPMLAMIGVRQHRRPRLLSA